MSATTHELPFEEDGARDTVRPLYWSIRREIWENRSIVFGPLIAAGLLVVGFFFNTFTLSKRMARYLTLDDMKRHEYINMPFNAAAGMLAVTAFIIGFFYCVDALYSERRDRSILFWKSLPVSDRTTVIAKACIPLVVLPLIVITLATLVQMFMLVFSTTVLAGNREHVVALWSHVKFIQLPFAFLFGLIAIALWHAPLYAYLLLVSAWARRAPVLWAILPLLGIAALERMTAGTSTFLALIGYRITGWFHRAFVDIPKGAREPIDPLAAITPARFLATPGLWIGLAIAAACLAAAVRLRRNREPI